MAHVSESKKQVVKELSGLLEQYPIVGAINMESLPAPQLQNMRSTLRKDDVVIRMAKRRLIKIAIDNIKDKKEGIDKIVPHLKGMPALLFAKENPFKLYKKLEKSKSSAPAKGGQIAPKDIVVPAGPTPFAPGPIIGELGMIGVKTGVEGGKVAVKEDSVVVREGQVIKPKVAEVLTRLNIYPMEIGLNLVAAYEKGNVFPGKLLAVDEKQYISNIGNAARWALNLSVEAGYATKSNIQILIGKVHRDSKAIALAKNILADAVVEELLAKAEREMLAVKSAGNIEVEPKKKL